MRQAQETQTGKWIGNPQGGVKAPDPLILPDPATRFARTAARLDSLSSGHPMAAWIDFMARLAEAQHIIAGALGPVAGPSRAAIAVAVEARLPVDARPQGEPKPP